MTKLEIIEETVDFYSQDTNRRASKSNGLSGFICSYENEFGNKCALGRCFDTENSNYSIIRYYEGNISSLIEFLITKEGEVIEKIKDENIIYQELENVLLPLYRGHELIFWKDLQNLHDTEAFWLKKGLTEKGLIYVQDLKQKYAKS